MTTTIDQRKNIITNIRRGAVAWLDAQNDLLALQRQWNAMGLSGQLTADDFKGENDGLTPAQVEAVLTTLAAEMALMAQGHATNLEAMRK